MKTSKEMTKISFKLISMIVLMVIILALQKYDVKADEPNYLTFEALEDDSQVGFYIDETTDSFLQYQKFKGEAWGEWISVTETGPNDGTSVELSRGEKVRFKGKNASAHFGGTKGSDGLVLDGYIAGKVKVSGDITSLTNEVGKLDNLAEGTDYKEIFKGCTGLVSADELVLPSTKLSENCYSGMFLGCENLESFPKLPATELADGCYSSMFKDCTKLTVAPELPAEAVANSCYLNMFNGCSSLTAAPELPAEAVADSCYQNMFSGCSSLTTAPDLPAVTLAPFCYGYMFEGCTSLITAPELPAEAVADSCYLNMFSGCSSLTTAPELPAVTLAPLCYRYMFEGCTSLITAPELPATMVADSCYDSMFIGCSNLQDVPSILPTDTLADACYMEMFSGCESITAAPELPAVEMKPSCYSNMFNGCKSLTTAPELPAAILANGCYTGMFEGCKKLRRIPKLPATTLAENCYSRMFTDCTSITIVPDFPENMQYAMACFYEMFKGCEKLAVIPSFKVLNWEEAELVFTSMFAGCTRLDVSETKDENYDRPWRIDGPGEDKYDSYEDYDEAVLPAIGWMFMDCTFDCGYSEYDEEDGSMLYKYLLPNKTYYFKTYRHDITIEESENGTVTVDKNKAAEDELLKLTVTPDPGYGVDRWEVNEGVEILDDNTFIMPDENVKIKASFRKIVNVWPTATAVYMQKLSDIKLINPVGNVEGTFSWKNPDTIIDKIGVYKYPVLFTPTDTVKYYAVEGDVEVTVDKYPDIKQNDPESNNGWGDIDEEDKFIIDPSKVKKDTINVVGIKDVIYTGQPVTFDIRVYKGTDLLKEGIDYTIKYLNNKIAWDGTASDSLDKQPQVILTGKGVYKEILATFSSENENKLKFKINRINLENNDTVIVSNEAALFKTGGKFKPLPTVTLAGKKLKNNADYTLEYLDKDKNTVAGYTEAGTYSVKVICKGNYAGTLYSTYILGNPDEVVLMNMATVTGIKKSVAYTGKEITLDEVKQSDVKVSVKIDNVSTDLVLGQDFEVKAVNNKEAGIATLIFSAKDGNKNKLVGEKSVTFKILGTPLSKTKVAFKLNKDDTAESKIFDYTGKRVTPIVVVTTKTGSKVQLEENKDYTVEYQKNINIGTAAVYIKGVGAYQGTLKKTFKIKAIDLSKSEAIKAEISGVKKQDNGKYTGTVKVTFNGRLLSEGKDYTFLYKNNVNPGLATDGKKAPSVVIKGKGNFTKTKTLTFDIVE